MKDKFKELQEDVVAEQKLIEKTVQCLSVIKSQLPLPFAEDDLKTEPAIGTYLMNFYNGVENIIKRICKVYYETFPLGKDWHKELLDLSYQPPEGKFSVFSQEIVSRLYKYKNFRHRFVSGYGFQLKAEKMLELVDDVEILWDAIQKDLNSFLEKLS